MAPKNIQVRFNEGMTEYGPVDTLAQRAKAARKYAQLTQLQASQASGVKQSDISKIERGQTLRPVGLMHLARAYGCNPFWLDTGNGYAPWELGGRTHGSEPDTEPDIMFSVPPTVQAVEVKHVQQSPTHAVSETDWALLQDFALLPDDEKQTLRMRLAEKARDVRRKADEMFFGKHNIPSPVTNERVAEAFGSPPPPPRPGQSPISTYKKITPVPAETSAPAKHKKGR